MVVDHGNLGSMESMPISKFKATCLGVIERVRRTGEPVLVTKRGEPIAEIVPASRPPGERRELGTLSGTAEIVGDIVSPVARESDWEALR
jgi:prevent-host-death family protein